MGDPAKKRKLYETPRKKWDKALLQKERKNIDTYGLKNKKELRRAETWLRNKRKISRDLLALPLEERIIREQELVGGLRKIGLVGANGTLDDILSLQVEALLEKRLQSIVLRKGLANTMKQARQFITHGHVAINGNKIDVPGYIVKADEVSNIAWYKEPIKIETETPKRDLKKEFEDSAKAEKDDEFKVEESTDNAEAQTEEKEKVTKEDKAEVDA